MWHARKPDAYVIAMDRTQTDHSLIAWMLYACLLFNLLACGTAHGQMTGEQTTESDSAHERFDVHAYRPGAIAHRFAQCDVVTGETSVDPGFSHHQVLQGREAFFPDAAR
jgi:hypothetical protein